MSKKRARLPAAVRREQILDASTELFIERGFGNVNMGEIADRLGTSRPNVYTYYPSPEAILEIVLDRSVKTGIAALRKDLEGNPSGNSSGVLPVLVRQRELVLLLYSAGTPVMRKHRERVLEAMGDYVKGLLPFALEAGEEQVLDELLLLQHHLYLSAAYTVLTQPDRYSEAGLGMHVQNMLEGGYTKGLPRIDARWREAVAAGQTVS